MPFLFIDDSIVKVPSSDLWESDDPPNVSAAESARERKQPQLWYEQYTTKRQQGSSLFSGSQQDSDLTAADVMSSPVVCLTIDDTLQVAMDTIGCHGFRHIPVLAKGSHLVGIVSERDIVSYIGDNPDGSLAELYKKRVVNFMVSTVLTVTAETPVSDVAYLMSCEGIGALPVIDGNASDGQPPLLGIITVSDLYVLVIDGIRIN